MVKKGMYDGKTSVVIKHTIIPPNTDLLFKKQISINISREAFISHQANQDNHANVVKFIGMVDHWEGDEKRSGLVFQLMSKGSLDKILFGERQYQSNKRSDVMKLVRMGLDAARGLSYLHGKKIVHRDVAIRNLLLDQHHRVW